MVENLKNLFGLDVGNGVKQAGIQIKKRKTQTENHAGPCAKQTFAVSVANEGCNENPRKGNEGSNTV